MKGILITVSLFCLFERQQASFFNSNACSSKKITPMTGCHWSIKACHWQALI
jgi:hypothetical protein